MTVTVIIVLVLTFFLHFISTVALSVRIVGIRTGKMAASYAVYNLIFLAARFTNTLQAPLLAKTIEKSILSGNQPNNSLFFNLCISAFLGSLLGVIFIPSMQRFMYKAVEGVYKKHSVLKVLFKAIHLKTFIHLKESLTIPKKENFYRLRIIKDMPLVIISLNIIVSALVTVSVLACLYAGYISPDLRTTSLSLNGFIVGASTVIFMVVVEPHIGIMADKVIKGEFSEVYFRRYLTFVVLARLLGTAISFTILIPLAHLIVMLAKVIFV